MPLPLPSFLTGPLGKLAAIGAKLPGAALVERHRSALAVLALAGLGTGMVQFGDAPVAAMPTPVAGTELSAPAPDEAEVDPDDGTTKRYLVVLHREAATPPTMPPTTTTVKAHGTTTVKGRATTTTVADAHGDEASDGGHGTDTTGDDHGAATATTVRRPVSTTPLKITTVPGEETQQAVIVRLDGSRTTMTVPLRYFTLAADPTTAARVVPGGVPTGRSLVVDRDGRYWTADLLSVPAVLYELDGQATANAAAPGGTTTAAKATTKATAKATTTTAHADEAASHGLSAASAVFAARLASEAPTPTDDAHHEATTAAPHTATEPAPDAHPAGATTVAPDASAHGDTTGHDTTGHDTAGHDTTAGGHGETPAITVAVAGHAEGVEPTTDLHTIVTADGMRGPTGEDHDTPTSASKRGRGTTTTVHDDGLPDNVRGPVADDDMACVLEIATMEGVRSVRSLGGGVYEVVVEIDAGIDEDVLASVPGVERVVAD